MSDDRSSGPPRRSESAAVRAAELRAFRDRLLDGHRLTAEDLAAAVEHLEEALRRAEEAHERAALAHRRTADTHRRAALVAEGAGDLAGAARHRAGAEEAERGAAVELDALAELRGRNHVRHEDRAT
jgi:hypothetical protein